MSRVDASLAEKEVYRVNLSAGFYVLAESQEHALRIAQAQWSTQNIWTELPAQAEPAYTASRIVAQDDYHRSRCVNSEDC